ncbi:hypothetical protein C9374_004109 [Naegleria lovaniensis]|uniref:Uncharacterized protein n=1 Tax=Naegleria lovaniensis TaxID=51637 RepID=A0AA88GS35_NAELO|nr:uncharacterized protein C9374_004109 [Naegleria lovaniensis]KAG2383438.1 hypothetical protein C9374_004109 [Naegleria lovaniensis]
MEDFEDDSFENYEPEEEYNDEHESFHEPNHEEHLDEPIYIPSSMNDDEEVHQQQQEYPSSFGDDIYGNIYDDDEVQNSKEFHHPSKESDHIIAVATIQENVNQSEEKIVTNTSSHVLEEEDESFEDFEDHHDEEEQDSAKIQLSTQNIISRTATCQEHLTTTTSQHKTETDLNHSTILNSSSTSNQKKPFSTVQEYDYTPYYQKRQKPYNEQEIKEYMKRKKAQEEKLSKQRQESTVVTPYYLARKKPYDEEKVKEFMKMKQERDRKKQEEQKQEIELRENASKEKTVSSSKNKPEMPEFLKKQLEQEEKSSHQVMDPRKRVKEYGKKVREKLAEDHEKIMAERRLAKKIALEKKRREMHHLKLDLHMSHFKLRESDEQSEDSTWSNWSAPAKLSDLDPKTYKSKSDKYCFKVTNSVIQQDGERIDSEVNNNTTSKEQDEHRRKIIEEALSLIAAAKQQPSQKEQVSNPTLPANESFSKLNISENQEFQQPDIISKSDRPVLNNCSSSNNNFSTAIQSLIMNLSRKTSSKEIQVSEEINSQTHSETNHKPETPNMFGDEKKNESHSLVMNGQPENKHLPETISLEHDQEQPSCRIEYFERAQLSNSSVKKSPRLLLQKKPSSKLIPQDFETTTQTIHEIQSKEMNDSCEILQSIPTPLTISENDHDNNHSEIKQSIPVQPLESCKTLTIEDDDQSSEASFSNEFYTKKDEIKKMVFSLMKKQETHPNKKKKEKHTKKLISLLNPAEVTQDDPFNIISTIREKKKQEELLERKRRKEKVKQELATLKQERKERMQQQLQNKQNHSTQENQNSSSPNAKCQNESGTHVGIQTYPQVTIEYDFEKDEEGRRMHVTEISVKLILTNYYYTSQTFNQQHVPLLNYWDYSHPPSFYPHGMETSIPMSNAPLLGTERIIENLVDERLSPSELAEKLLDSLTVYEKVLESEARFTSLLALNN